MAEGPIHRKTIQQNLVNYISHNLGKKAEKDKETEKEKTDSKNSSGKGTKADRTSTNSASHPNRPKTGAQGQGAPSTQSSTTKPVPRRQTPSEQHTTQTRNSTPGSTIPPKSRTPPSLEKANKPQKRLNMEDNNMEIDAQTINNSRVEESRSITRSNIIEGTTRQNDMSRPTTNIDETRSNKTLETTPRGDNRSGATRQNNEATGSNANVTLETTRRNKEETRNNDSTPIDSNIADSTDSTEAIVTNPFETEDSGNEGETLDDLGPELVKMGRILAREITKSLSRALIPLQNEINDLKTTNRTPPGVSDWQRLKDENEKLHTKVYQLELNNSKLQMKLSRMEDKLVDNNLLFFGINELEGETEQDRYSVILEVIASTFVGPTQEIRLEQAKNVMIESLTRKGRYNPSKIRPISVSFMHLRDQVNLLMNRKYCLMEFL